MKQRRMCSSKKFSFKGMLKCNPVNVDTGGLRKALRITAKQKKQLDLSLNHAVIIDTTKVLEEDMDLGEDNLTNDSNKLSNSNNLSIHIENIIANNQA